MRVYRVNREGSDTDLHVKSMMELPEHIETLPDNNALTITPVRVSERDWKKFEDFFRLGGGS